MGASGSKVDEDRSAEVALSKIGWRTLVMQKDNLHLNACLVALQQLEMVDDMDADGTMGKSLLDLSCFAHSCVLCMKPLIKSLGIDGHIVRLGHILESGRSWQCHLENLDHEVQIDFEYVWWGRTHPPDLQLWRAK